MPRRPRKPCARPGCKELVDAGVSYCDAHKRERDKDYTKNKRNPEAKKIYNHSWVKLRNYYRDKHPLCEKCLEKDVLTTGQVVHHINEDPKDNRMENLMSLCNLCHARIHAKSE